MIEKVISPSDKKKSKILKNFSRLITEFLSGKAYVPLSAEELVERLNIPDEHHSLFKQSLKSLSRDGSLENSGDRYHIKAENKEVATGTIHVHHRGFGFLSPDDPIQFSQDIFVPKHLTGNAVDGDTVEVLINQSVVSEKGPEGKVIAIVNRARTHIAGTIQFIYNSGIILAYVPLLGLSRRVLVEPPEDLTLIVGDRVIMKVQDWGNSDNETKCEVSHRIGNVSDPSVDIRAAIEEFELQADFPNQVLQDVKAFGSRVSTKEIAKREDLRDLECFTIDPTTAKDFDDALTLSKEKNGHYHLGVHIADVSHYVRAGTPLDHEATRRCNSTYFPGFCLPMIPSKLSENLCSLKPNVNRLTISVMMELDSTGSLVDYKIFRSVIRSARRFTYHEARLILDGEMASKHAPKMHLMSELCGVLKKKRNERGCIEFALPESRVIVDEHGVPEKIEVIQYDVTHQLVEEFMIKANEVIATHLTGIGKELSYRVHDEPSEENIKDFSIIAGAYGFNLSETPTTKELQNLFDEARQTAYGQHLATSYIRSMKLASYSPTNIGHYGLSLEHYCHFTSPIRRYADLAVHRQLFSDTEDEIDFEAISNRCSEQERISSKAENAVIVLKKLRLLEKIKENNRHHQFDAVISKVKPFGIYFEVLDVMLEGFLRISEIGDDYFVYNEEKLSLKGNRTNTSFRCGDRISVMLVESDLITLESTWSIVPEKHQSRPKPDKKTDKKSEKRSSRRPSKKPFNKSAKNPTTSGRKTKKEKQAAKKIPRSKRKS
ncbi:MAG: ribonuclease R [Chlamydiales bacterium]|jgi:ribonuclease R